MIETRHATTIAIRGHAVMLIGQSGAGKSDLAIRLIDRGALLVADDYTCLVATDGRLTASPPTTISGKIELRGVGIVTLPFVDHAPVRLAVLLDAPVERLPEPRTTLICGVAIPLCTVAAYEASAAIKVEWALAEVLR